MVLTLIRILKEVDALENLFIKLEWILWKIKSFGEKEAIESVMCLTKRI